MIFFLQMKAATIVIVMSLLLPLSMVATAEEDELGNDYEETQISLQPILDWYSSQLAVLRGVVNRATADVAAKEYHKLSTRPQYRSALLNTHLWEDSESIGQQNIIATYKAKTETEFSRLREALYFGSGALARELAGAVAYAQPSRPLPTASQQELAELCLQQAEYSYGCPRGELPVSGGHGFSREEARIIKAHERYNPLHVMELLLPDGYGLLDSEMIDGKLYYHGRRHFVHEGVHYHAELWIEFRADATQTQAYED